MHKIVKDLFMDRLPLKMFIMSKKLSRDPLNYASKGPHVQLALKLAKKDPLQAPVSGDRVEVISGPFVNFVATVEKIDAQRRVWILMELMGQGTRVKVQPEQLKLSTQSNALW